MTFGEKLKQLRIREEYSQEQLAEKLHVSRQAVTKWESGAGLPDIDNLKTVADLFDVTLDSLLRDEEELETPEESRHWNIALACAGVGAAVGWAVQMVTGGGSYLFPFALCGGAAGFAACYIAAQWKR